MGRSLFAAAWERISGMVKVVDIIYSMYIHTFLICSVAPMVFSIGSSFAAAWPVGGRLSFSSEKCRAPMLYTDGGLLWLAPVPKRLREESAGVKGRSVGSDLMDFLASAMILVLVCWLGVS